MIWFPWNMFDSELYIDFYILGGSRCWFVPVSFIVENEATITRFIHQLIIIESAWISSTNIRLPHSSETNRHCQRLASRRIGEYFSLGVGVDQKQNSEFHSVRRSDAVIITKACFFLSISLLLKGTRPEALWTCETRNSCLQLSAFTLLSDPVL